MVQIQQLLASDGAAGGELGVSLAMDANNAVVGTYRDGANTGL